MDNQLQTTPEPRVSTLVKEIVQDVQGLLGQQADLIRREIEDDLRKTKNAAIWLALGIAVGVLGCGMLFLMLPHLLVWLWPALPLWSGYVIVGGVLAAVGGALLFAGIRKFQSFNPLPDESFAALKENVQWITNPK